jgi:transcriptional antiterminator RfaH
MNPAEEFHWYCLKSQPKHEHIAAAHLRLVSDLQVYAPRIRFQRATSQGARWFEEAMFPGYLFARFQFSQRHREVRYAAGVSSILQFGDSYARVDECIIASLREQTNPEGVALVQSEIKEGQPVKVVNGALLGLEAVVTQVLTGRERIRILVNFFGRQMTAEVQRPRVLPAQRHPLAA